VKLDDLANDLDELEELRNEKEKIDSDIQNSLQNFKVKNLDELSRNFGLKDFSELFDHVKSLDDEAKQSDQRKKHTLDSIKEKYEKIERLERQIEANKQKEEESSKLDLEIALLNEVQTYVEKFIAEDLISIGALDRYW